MGAGPAALLLAALAILLLRDDLRLLVRRRRWLRVSATVERVGDAHRPTLRLRFTLPDGRSVATETSDLRHIARLEPGSATGLLVDPRDPAGRFAVPRPAGLAAAAGLALAGLAFAALLR